MKPYDKEIVEYINNNKDKYYTNELVLLIKAKFDKDITTKSLRKYFYRHNLTFKRKYNRKDNCVFAKKIGFESLPDKNGLVRIKINDKQWQYKQRYLYEQYHNVKLPKDYVVIFLDGNKNNFKKNNLYAIPKNQMRVFYALTHDNKIKNKNLTKIGLQIATLKSKIKEKEVTNKC